jgi:hypothetical protein
VHISYDSWLTIGANQLTSNVLGEYDLSGAEEGGLEDGQSRRSALADESAKILADSESPGLPQLTGSMQIQPQSRIG